MCLTLAVLSYSIHPVRLITDDVDVYGRTEKEHDDNFMNLKKVDQENGLIFNSEKCIMKTREIPFAMLIYTADGVNPDPDQVEAIRALPTPQKPKELKEFISITRQSRENSSCEVPSMHGCLNMLKHSPPSNC